MNLTFVVFLGSARNSSPPYPARLGLRVARACVARLGASGAEVHLVDPLDCEPTPVFKPHFAYPPGEAPAALEALAARIGSADGYVMVSAEYNHSMSPALAHLLNHFGSSLFAFKPSAIVTYPAGQDERAWTGYFGRTLGQLEWWAAAARDGRAARDPHAMSPAFRRRVSERDAPTGPTASE